MVKFSKLVSKNFEKFGAFSFGESVGLTFLTGSCFSSFHCLSPSSLCQQTLENWVLFWVASVLFLPRVSWSSFLYSGPCGPPKDHADHLLIQQVRLSVSSLICLALFTRSFRIHLNFFLPFWYNTLLVFFSSFSPSYQAIPSKKVVSTLRTLCTCSYTRLCNYLCDCLISYFV